MTNFTRTASVVAALLFPATWAVADGNGSPADPDIRVEMTDDHRFSPETVVIRQGDRVSWRNTSLSDHTVTCVSIKIGSTLCAPVTFESGLLRPGQTFEWRFREPGVFGYVCTIHEKSSMRGTVKILSAK